MKKEKKLNYEESAESEEITEKNAPADDISDEKLDIKKSVFEVNKEIRQKQLEEQARQQAELERKLEEREKRKQEAYERKILEEKKELIRLKQGIIEESEIIPEEHEAAVILSPWKKFTNFIYHNKWWLGIGILFAAIAVFLIHDLVTKPNPDIIVLVICDNYAVGEESNLQEYIESFTDDFNGNGKVLASVYYIPVTDNEFGNYGRGVDTNLTTQLQSADGVIVIGGKKLLETLGEHEIFTDIREIVPESDHIKGGYFRLKDTKFAEKIGIDPEEITSDMFIAIRKPQTLLYTKEEEMQEVYDKDLPVFEKILADIE